MLVAAALVLGVPAVGAADEQAGARRAWPSDGVAGSLLVTTDSDDRAIELGERRGGTTIGRVAVLRVVPGTEASQAATIALLDGVVAVEPNHRRLVARVPNDPGFGAQWAHQLSRMPAAWDRTVGSATVRMAVIDTGVDGRHPDLAANIVEQVDVSTGQVVVRPTGSDNDPCGVGHGTGVAGVMAAMGDNGLGVAGVAWNAAIIDIAATDPLHCGSFTDASIVAGIQHATARGAKVVNLSLGGPSDTCPTAFQATIDAARSAGVVVVAAAGNEQRFLPGVSAIPASCNGVVSVGAATEGGQRASYSNVNAWVDVLAPGGDTPPARGVLTTALGGGTNEAVGTSFSAPYVAGLAGLVAAVRPELSPDQVEAVITRTTIGAPARSNAAGWGVVDGGAAVALAASGAAIVARSPTSFPVGLVARVGPAEGVTDAVRQAVAMSRYAFSDGIARHAVVARADDYADALAGASLAYGVGPVLFTASSGPLAAATTEELVRAVRPGATVYLLGGVVALPASLEAEIAALGFVPKRLSGPDRSATAAVVADEVQRRVAELGFEPSRTAVVVTEQNWPDAAVAGSLGSLFGMPILLTAPAGPSNATLDALRRLAPQRVIVVGGTVAVSDEAFAAIAQAVPAATVDRRAGPDRVATALAVAREVVLLFRAEVGFDPISVVAVNVRRADGFAHVLSASDVVGSQSGILLPIEGEAGDVLPAGSRALACSLDPQRAIVAGGKDLVAETIRDALIAIFEVGC